MSSISLLGLPGSGKTILGKLLAEKTGRVFLDFDDDVLEEQTRSTVAQLLENLQEDGFKKLEEELGLGLDFQNTVFASSGSLPYSKKVMRHLAIISTRVYLHVPENEILERASQMKTDRIIGMGDMTLKEIFKARADLYTSYADIIFPYSGSNFDTITNNLIGQIEEYQKKQMLV